MLKVKFYNMIKTYVPCTDMYGPNNSFWACKGKFPIALMVHFFRASFFPFWFFFKVLSNSLNCSLFNFFMIFWNEKVTFRCILATTNNTSFIRKCCYKQFTSWTASPMLTTAANQLPWYGLYFQQTFSKEMKLLFINSTIYYKQFVICTLHLILLKVTKLK